MSRINQFSTALALFVASGVALASPSMSDMVGTWKWEDFVIKVQKCSETGVCAKVVSGPKNVGLNMIKTALKQSDDSFTGRIAHPQTGDTYNSKISMVNKNQWHIDGCTDANVCASGDFTRMK